MSPGTVVIGGGIIGLACAYELASAGHQVQVVDRASVGKGSSSGNAGWVTLSHCYPVPSPGSVRAALKSAGHADAPLYVRPSVSPRLVRWLYEFQKYCRPAAFRPGRRSPVRPGRADREALRQVGGRRDRHHADQAGTGPRLPRRA